VRLRLTMLIVGAHLAHAECQATPQSRYLGTTRPQRERQGLGDTLTLDEAHCSRDKLAGLLPTVLGQANWL